ncbi:MAG: hypothetical protein H7138_03755 [Myxococcales bacterium]|nr:hypothetical protein [Myxococcales bacterium]
MHRTLTLAVSLTMFVACSKADQPAPVAPAQPAAAPAAAVAGNSELENKGITMMQRMADMFVADAEDCEKLAVDIKAFIVEHRELIGQLTEGERAQSDQEKLAFEQRNKPVQEAVVAKMEPVIAKCGANPNVQAAMKDFPAE